METTTKAPTRDQQIAYEILRGLAKNPHIPHPLRSYLEYLTSKPARVRYLHALRPYLDLDELDEENLNQGALIYFDEWLEAMRALQADEAATWKFSHDSDENDRLRTRRMRQIAVICDPMLYEYNGTRDENATGVWPGDDDVFDTCLATTHITRLARAYYFEEEARTGEDGEQDMDLVYEAGVRSPDVDAALGYGAYQNHPAGARHTSLTEHLITLPLVLAEHPLHDVNQIADDHA